MVSTRLPAAAAGGMIARRTTSPALRAGEVDAQRRVGVPRGARNEAARRTVPHRAIRGTLTLAAVRLDLSRAAGEVLVALMLLTTPTFAAGEDNDLNLIPPAAQQPAPAVVPASPGSATQRNYLEDAISVTPLRDSLAVPFPPPTPASWEDRLFLDFARRMEPGGRRHADL